MDKEQLLVKNLRTNGRATLTEISKNTKIPISSLYDMLKKTDKITRHTCLPDFSKLGYGVKAVFIVKVEVSSKEDFRKFLIKHPIRCSK